MQNFGSSGNFNNDDYRIYPLWVVVNGFEFQQIVISSHYERKHKDSVNDHLILKMVRQLHHRRFLPMAKDEAGFQYFVAEPVVVDDRPYRLIWLIPPDRSYLGVRNAFRRTYGKKD